MCVWGSVSVQSHALPMLDVMVVVMWGVCVCVQVDRHLRKLDQELAKFKMELEADNAGITEILERRESPSSFLELS